ncbi:MAG TPA: tRNA glutamyl-Q(34) synthetase GluQRS [Polyangiaceae bacterium LLY-WYZ-14_1]|nr:tRNA glutamyl-Q(34) synthetase GluQRS [Polyangiaceae bacterium LLY-WYZ-14_1]
MTEPASDQRAPSDPRPPGGYRGRLAPSPTGALHLGHARTSLVAWLRARQAGGTLILRIEDLDGPRTVSGAEAGFQRDLAWLGLDWDEGPDRGGPAGPYRQSERGERYREAVRQLEARRRVFPCTCSRKEVARVASAPHGFEELGVAYPGTCRDRPSHPGRTPAWRFRFDPPAPPFVDGLHGSVSIPEAASDFVVERADGVFAYQLAVVVDDEAMGVTEVVRGDDLLSSTPRQLALYEALGWSPPAFFHLPLVVDAGTGERLSKRHRSEGVAALREAGRRPEEIVGRLARSLGMAEVDAARPAELLPGFDASRIPLSPVAVPAGSRPPG